MDKKKICKKVIIKLSATKYKILGYLEDKTHIYDYIYDSNKAIIIKREVAEKTSEGINAISPVKNKSFLNIPIKPGMTEQAVIEVLKRNKPAFTAFKDIITISDLEKSPYQKEGLKLLQA